MPDLPSSQLLKKLIVNDNVLFELKVNQIQSSQLSATILRTMGLKGHCSLPKNKIDTQDNSEMNHANHAGSLERIISENCLFTSGLFVTEGKYQADNLTFDCPSSKYAVDGYILDENINRNIPLMIKKGDTFYLKILAR